MALRCCPRPDSQTYGSLEDTGSSETILITQWIYIVMTLKHTDGARSAYDHIAPFYDDFTAHHDCELWLRRLLAAAEPFGLCGKRLLDVACGTGKSFLPMLDSGWQVTGCDLSEGMLAGARAKVGDRARLEVADMRALPRLGSFDLVWCLDDAINYLLTPAELVRCVIGLRANLAPEGLVLFDVNTLLSYRTFFAETQGQEAEGGRLVWSGHASADTPAGAQVEATFEVVPGPDQSPSRAIHRQRHFPPEEVLRALDTASLHCLAVFGHDLSAVLERPLDESRHTKAVFIAKAKGERR
jgi:SAM-dependent methyltransferase